MGIIKNDKIVYDYTGGSHHHRLVYISDKNQEDFIQNILLTQVKTKNKLSRELIYGYLKSITTYNQESTFDDEYGLYQIRHFANIAENNNKIEPMTHNGTFCHSIFLHDSSPDWWKNMDTFLSKEENLLLKYYFHWPHEENIDPINCSAEDLCHEHYIKKNIALSISGWNPDDPPMEFLIFGDKSNVTIPRFSSAGTSGLSVFFSSDENGQIISASVSEGGTNYFLNDRVSVRDGKGTGAILKVTEVKNGSAKNVSIISGGQNYILSGNANTIVYGWDGILGEHCFPKHPDLFS